MFIAVDHIVDDAGGGVSCTQRFDRLGVKAMVMINSIGVGIKLISNLGAGGYPRLLAKRVASYKVGGCQLP
jgi:hypothetical protein